MEGDKHIGIAEESKLFYQELFDGVLAGEISSDEANKRMEEWNEYYKEKVSELLAKAMMAGNQYNQREK